MIDLGNEYYGEAVLKELLHKGEIDHLTYIFRHSEEKKMDFMKYCQEHHQKEDNESAQQYMEYLLKQEEEAHTDALD